MDLIVTSTGKTFYEVNPTVAAILCEAFPESFRRLNQPEFMTMRHAPPSAPGLSTKPAPKFNVGQTPTGEAFIFATDGRTELYYTGTPEGAADHVFAGFIGGATVAPAAVVEEYRRVKYAASADPEFAQENCGTIKSAF